MSTAWCEPCLSSPRPLLLLPQAADAWWAALLREETLGRLVWIVENTLSPALLERS